jgi:LuxR family transcriptional regulator, maltose regulon positive regulatory protein
MTARQGDMRLDRHRLRAPRSFMPEVPRPHLEQLADRALEHAIVLVHADAGYGKTTFARLCAARHPAAWYCVDPSDNDPQRFTAHLQAGLRQLLPGDDTGAPHGAWVDVVDELLEALEQRLPEQALLILDDLHTITDEPTIAAAAYFLERLPAPLTAVVTSQTVPPFPALHRWQVEGRLVTLGRDDLHFLRPEVEAFFATRYGRQLAADTAADVHALCEGWPVAMHLLGSAMADDRFDVGRADLKELLAPDRGPLHDYLRQHVLTQHDEATQRFLLMTAVVDDFDEDLANGLLGTSTADLLARVRDSGLYLTSDGHGAYTYQGWFRDFLRSEVDPATRVAAHQRAAAQLEARGRLEEAVSQHLAAGDPEAAAGLLERLAPLLIAEGQHVRVLTLTDPLPTAVRARHPGVQLARADALRLASRFDEAEAEASAADECAKAAGQVPARFAALERLAQIHLDTVRPARATTPLTTMGSLLPLLGPAERSRWQRLVAENQLNAGDLASAAGVLGDLGPGDPLPARLATREGNLPQALARIRPLPAGGSGRSPRSHREQHALMAWVLALQGDGDSAYREALDGIETGRLLASPIVECLCTGRAGLALMSKARSDATELADADDLLGRSLSLADAIRLPRFRAEALIGLTVARGRSGDWGDARQHGIEAISVLEEAGDAYLTGLAELGLGVAAVQCDHPEAELWLQRAILTSTRVGESYFGTLAHLWLAELHLSGGNRPEAAAHATTALATMRHRALDCLLRSSPWLGIPTAGDRQRLAELGRADEGLAGYARYLVDTNAKATLGGHRQPDHCGLDVRLMGDFAVHVDGVAVPRGAWRRRKGRELFWLLCVHPRHSLTRDQAAAWLWPEGNVDATSVRFRVALHALRAAVEPDRTASGSRFVHSNHERLWLDPEVTVDLDAFREAVRAAAAADASDDDLRNAVDLYAGGLLPSAVAVPWLEPWRRELSQSWTGLALRSAGRALDAGRPTFAVPVLRAVLREQPFEENAYRLLSAALARTGQPGAARAVHEDCARQLAEELGIRPSWSLADVGL